MTVIHLPVLAAATDTGRARLAVVTAAAEQLGWPYIWGGDSRGEGGFDCSGLVDYAYAAAGFPLPGRPTAAVLWRMSTPIAARNLRPGDLVFMGAPSGDPYHVALYVGNNLVIVAPHRGRAGDGRPVLGDRMGRLRPALVTGRRGAPRSLAAGRPPGAPRIAPAPAEGAPRAYPPTGGRPTGSPTSRRPG